MRQFLIIYRENLASRCVAYTYIYSTALKDEGTASSEHLAPLSQAPIRYECNKQQRKGKILSYTLERNERPLRIL